MRREPPVRIREGLGVQFPRATRLGRLGNIIEAVGRAIDAGSFFPVESPLNCSGCGYFRECRGWTGPGSSSSGDRELLQVEEVALC